MHTLPLLQKCELDVQYTWTIPPFAEYAAHDVSLAQRMHKVHHVRKCMQSLLSLVHTRDVKSICTSVLSQYQNLKNVTILPLQKIL